MIEDFEHKTILPPAGDPEEARFAEEERSKLLHRKHYENNMRWARRAMGK